MWQLRFFLFLLAALWVLSGCAPSTPAEHWRDYAERIARTLDFELAEPPPAELPPFPSRRRLQQRVEPMSMSLLDFMRWRACDLQRLIGERNSALGKVMPDSQQLLYEHRLMVAVADCLASDETLPREAEDWLKRVLEHKRSQRAPLFWNGVVASPEMQAFFSPGVGRLSVEAGEGGASAGAMPRGLRAAASLLHGYDSFGVDADAVEGEAWERRYQKLGERPVAYEILLAMEESTRWLNAINRQMAESLEARPVCPQGVLTPKARVMQRILTSRYQGLMQPFLSRIERWHESLVAAFEPVLGMGGIDPPPAWRRYSQRYLTTGDDSVHSDFRRAIVEHTEVWQTLLSACGAMPSRPGT